MPDRDAAIANALRSAGAGNLPDGPRRWLYERVGVHGLDVESVNLGGLRPAGLGECAKVSDVGQASTSRRLARFATIDDAADALVEVALRAGAEPDALAPDIENIGDVDENGQWHAHWRFGTYVDKRGRERRGWHRHPRGTAEVGAFKPGDRVIFPDGVHVLGTIEDANGNGPDGRTIRVCLADGGERWAHPNEILHECHVEPRRSSGESRVYRDDETPTGELGVGWILFLGPSDEAKKVYSQLRADWAAFEQAGVGAGKLAFLKTDLDEWKKFSSAWEFSDWTPTFSHPDVGPPQELGTRLNAEVARANRVRAEIVSAQTGKFVAPGDVNRNNKGLSDSAEASPFGKMAGAVNDWAHGSAVINWLTDPKQSPEDAGKRIVTTAAAALAVALAAMFALSRRAAVVVNVGRKERWPHAPQS